METQHYIQENSAFILRNQQQMKKLEIASVITMVLGVLSIIAVLFTYLALCDIGHQEPDLTLEWNIVGIGLLIWIAFIISTLILITFLFRMMNQKSS